jgi:hypothetical protein
VVAQPLRRAETLVLFLVLVWPLCGSGGEGGSRVPLAFGWEVPVSIHGRQAGSGKERGTRRGARDVFQTICNKGDPSLRVERIFLFLRLKNLTAFHLLVALDSRITVQGHRLNQPTIAVGN